LAPLVAVEQQALVEDLQAMPHKLLPAMTLGVVASVALREDLSALVGYFPVRLARFF
jgi:hypothetical protein